MILMISIATYQGGMCALEMNVTNYTGDLYIFQILEEDGSQPLH